MESELALMDDINARANLVKTVFLTTAGSTMDKIHAAIERLDTCLSEVVRCKHNGRGDRRSDGFTVSTGAGWSERGSHGGTLAPLAAPIFVYTAPGIFFAEKPMAT